MRPEDESSSQTAVEGERFREIVRRSPDGIIVVDERGTILAWNEGEERLSGLPRAEAVGRPIWDVQHRLTPARQRTDEALRRRRERTLEGLAERTRLYRVLEEEIERPDGERRFQQSVLVGLDVGAGAICRDVTERRRLEEELREHEALLSEAERLAHLGHWEYDLRAGRPAWSRELFRIFGLPPERGAPGRDGFLGCIHPEDRERVARGLAATLEDGVTRRAEYRTVTPAGETRTLFGSVALLCDADGAPARLVGSVQDVSERKALEQALDEANRRKDEFLAVLSHELRNPLTPIRTSLHVMGKVEPGSERDRRMREVIARQVTHLARLVDDLLDVTRIGRGRVQLRRERLDLAQLLERTVEDHRQAFEAAGVRLERGAGPGPALLSADPTRVAQIVGNLLSNALKFTPRGGTVRVALRREGDVAVLEVEDDGVGIAREMLGRLFEPFSQADRTLERARGGLGLGLALVKGLAELHGGTASADSAGPGRGAAFAVRLPLEAAQQARQRPRPDRRPRPRRVLIVEDNRDAAESLKEALVLDGHEVRVAYDGPAGICCARESPPEVVLCDVGLPGMDGYEVARLLRSDEALRRCTLVALTGYARPEDKERAARAGFHLHLAKPPSMDELAEILANAAARE